MHFNAIVKFYGCNFLLTYINIAHTVCPRSIYIELTMGIRQDFDHTQDSVKANFKSANYLY